MAREKGERGRIKDGNHRFVETQTGVSDPFNVEVHEIGFDGENFTTLRVSMIESYMMFGAHKTELDALLNRIDTASIGFGGKPQSKKWRFVPRTDPMGPLPYYTQKFIFPFK